MLHKQGITQGEDDFTKLAANEVHAYDPLVEVSAGNEVQSDLTSTLWNMIKYTFSTIDLQNLKTMIAIKRKNYNIQA